MTWRRFAVLLRCLSPMSATLTKMREEHYIGTGPRVVRGAEATQQAFESLFAPADLNAARQRVLAATEHLRSE